MALVTPIVNSVSAFDSSTNYTFTFEAMGGDQVVKNEIIIKTNNIANTTVYNSTVSSLQFNQTVASGTLTNGFSGGYTISFRTYDASNNTSAWATPVPFYCYTTPVFSLNVASGGTVGNSSYNFITTYTQIEGEKLDHLIMDLYDANDVFISSSGSLYSTATPPLTLSSMFSGLANNTSYKMKVTGTTIYGTVIPSIYIPFNVVYANPTLFSTIDLQCDCCNGLINIDSNIIAIDGQSRPTPPTYIESNTAVDSTGSCTNIDSDYSNVVYWDSGFEIPKNFVAMFRTTPSTFNNAMSGFGELLTLKSTDGVQWVKFYLIRQTSYDRIVVKSSDGTLVASNTVSHLNSTSDLFVWLKVVGTTWTLQIQTLSQSTTTFNWNDTNDNISYNTVSDVLYVGESYENVTYTENQVALTQTLTKVINGNGILRHVQITSDTSLAFSTTIPSWTTKTVLDCGYNGIISGGNIAIAVSQISSLQIKRKDKNTSDWVAIYEQPVSTASDLIISTDDRLVPSGLEQEYAIVPILQGSIEGDYITAKITPTYNGTFVTNGIQSFKLYNAVIYSTTTMNKPIGLLTPLGRQYPIRISNSDNKYQSGSVSAQLCGYNFETNRTIDRQDVVQQTNDFMDFLVDGSAKVIVDWNGNDIMCGLASSPTIDYVSNYGNGITNVSFSWVESGKYNNQSNLYENGFTTIS